MEVRRRLVETVRPADDAHPLSTSESQTAHENVRNILVEEGHRLYAEAENSGFQNTAKLLSGLHYFLRAATQGQDEAIDWISSFLSSMSALPPTAITALPSNLLHLLQWVHSATSEEKEVYLVAEAMFHSMSRGDTAITRTGFDSAVQNLLFSQHEHSPQLIKSAKGLRTSVKKMLFSALESNESTEVTLDMFCESAVTYARGVLPHDDGTLTPQQEQDFKEANILKKVTKYPIPTTQYYKRSVLKLIERRGIKWIWSSFPMKQFYLLLLAYVLPMISAHFILTSIATALFMAAFIATCVATLQIMLASEKVFSFIEYSSIFQYFSEGDRKLDTRKPELLLVKRSVAPFLTFSASYCITLLTFHLSHHNIIPNELVCIISAFFTLSVFLQFECYKSPLFLASTSTRLLAWIYVFLIAVQEIIPIPEFLLYFGSASVSVPILSGFSISVNLPTLIQFPVQCLLIVYFLVQNKWHNVYSGLGPYLLFISWWVITRHFFVLSSPIYLFLCTFGLIILLGISPFLPVLFLVSPVYVLYYYGFSTMFFVYIGIIMCFLLLLLVLGKFSKKLMEAKWLNISFDYLVLLQVLTTIPIVLFGSSLVTRYYSPSDVPVVSVAQYSQYCGPQNWGGGGGNMIQTQLNCLHLRDRVLMASGIVEEVKIQEISNDHELSLYSLSNTIRAALTCMLGRLEPMCGHRSDMETCKGAFTGCHFHHSNKYTFAINMNMNLQPPPQTVDHHPQKVVSVVLLASSTFTTIVQELKVGDNLKFNATFDSGMGSDRVVLRLIDLEGVYMGKDEEIVEDQILANQVERSFTHTLNILFDVILGYTVLQ